mmetsp:Transcript_4281/g.15983  ORF Transcript_4281/g.15983 Transcript_4281/m.15983 type:complete len:248 (-) Transcript_4281:754-1497(-)
MSSVGLAVNVNAAVAHARMQSRFTSYGWALMLSNKGFILGVGPSRGRTPQLTNAPRTALGRTSRSAPPPSTVNAMRQQPVTKCDSLVFAPERMPKDEREMTPATVIPPTAAEQMLATPCATSSLSLLHSSPSCSAQNLHTAAPSRYVITPSATPGTTSAFAISGPIWSAAGGNSEPRSTWMAPTHAPTSTPLAARTQPRTQHTSAEGNILWIFPPLSMMTNVAAARANVPGCQIAGCAASHAAAVAK